MNVLAYTQILDGKYPLPLFDIMADRSKYKIRTFNVRDPFDFDQITIYGIDKVENNVETKIGCIHIVVLEEPFEITTGEDAYTKLRCYASETLYTDDDKGRNWMSPYFGWEYMKINDYYILVGGFVYPSDVRVTILDTFQ